MSGKRPLRNRAVLLVAGFATWATVFVILYAVQAVGCRFGWDEMPIAGLSVHRLSLLVLHALALGALIVLLVFLAKLWQSRAARRDQRFLDELAFWSACCALGATAVVFAPTLLLATC